MGSPLYSSFLPPRSFSNIHSWNNPPLGFCTNLQLISPPLAALPSAPILAERRCQYYYRDKIRPQLLTTWSASSWGWYPDLRRAAASQPHWQGVLGRWALALGRPWPRHHLCAQDSSSSTHCSPLSRGSRVQPLASNASIPGGLLEMHMLGPNGTPTEMAAVGMGSSRWLWHQNGEPPPHRSPPNPPNWLTRCP